MVKGIEIKYNITFFHCQKKVKQKSLALKKATTLIQFQSNTCNFYVYLLLRIPVLLLNAHQNLTSVIINHQNFNPKLRIYF